MVLRGWYAALRGHRQFGADARWRLCSLILGFAINEML